MIAVGRRSELCELSEKWTSDKCFYYTPFYHELLKDKRNARKVLEVGIGYPGTMLDSISRMGWKEYKTGASLYMWKEYFPEAEIFALDNQKDILINEDRIHSFYCEQSDASTYPLEQLGKDFDLIVEDGSHVKEHQLTAMNTLMPLLAPDGIYIMEDVGYLARACRLALVKEIPYPAELHEFHNPKLGAHIAACIVVRP